MDFALPELGEGVYEAEAVRWLVKPGDVVKRGQPLLEVMTDKATMEVPAPFAGKVTTIIGEPGSTLKVGQIILSYQSDGAKSEAAVAAASFGGNVALKAIAPGLLHKSDIGAVRLGLTGPSAVSAAADEMAQRVEAATGKGPTGFVVQQMAPSGVEMLVGVVNDRLFGPTVACGAGGTQVELLNDVSVRLGPLTHCMPGRGGCGERAHHERECEPPLPRAHRPRPPSS